MSLRGKLVRLAHSNPELRPHLVPLLKKARDTMVRRRTSIVLEESDFKNRMVWQGIEHDFDVPTDGRQHTVTLFVVAAEID